MTQAFQCFLVPACELCTELHGGARSATHADGCAGARPLLRAMPIEKKPGNARTDLEKLNAAFRATEEGRAELFQLYRLLLPEVLNVHFHLL